MCVPESNDVENLAHALLVVTASTTERTFFHIHIHVSTGITMNMTKKTLIATGLMAIAPLASAEGYADYFSANVALTSDYVWRGVSQTDEGPAIQGGIDFAHPVGVYVGVWGSNIDFPDVDGDDAHLELDYYGGYAHDFGNGFGADIGLIYYSYPKADGLNWLEGYLKGSYSKDGFDAGLSVNYSNDVFDSNEKGTYFDGSVGYTFDKTMGIFSSPAVSGGVGYYKFDEDVFGPGVSDNYWTWNAGASIDVVGFTVDARYYDTNGDGEDMFGDDIAGSRFVASISRSF